MIESTAYFESYKHVLYKLKEMDKWDDLPLGKYLIGEQKTDIDAPILFDELQEDILEDGKEKLNAFLKKIK